MPDDDSFDSWYSMMENTIDNKSIVNRFVAKICKFVDGSASVESGRLTVKPDYCDDPKKFYVLCAGSGDEGSLMIIGKEQDLLMLKLSKP